MTLQQGLDAPQQLQDIFDSSDALWEAERVLQVALERVGRHVERLSVCEQENSAAVQSCFSLILAASDPQAFEESTLQQALQATEAEEESGPSQPTRYTRGGIPIKAEATTPETLSEQMCQRFFHLALICVRLNVKQSP